MIKRVPVILVLAALLVGCLPPKIIHHAAPDLKVDFTPFEDAGCPVDMYGNYRWCLEDSPIHALGCDRIASLPVETGALQPALPLARCIFIPGDHEEIADPWNLPQSEYIYDSGGPYPELVRYVAYEEGDFRLIKSAEEFRAVFAPVESPDEALAFALALADVFTMYDQDLSSEYRYEVRTLEDTYVETKPEGYLVHVFDYQFFGCGPHYYYAVELLVTADGLVEEIRRQAIYRDPLLDGLCQD